MTLEQFLDALAALLLVGGAFFCFAGALGLVRFTDILARMHAATKPQVFGVFLAVVGVGLHFREFRIWMMVLLVLVMQATTAPVAAHLIGRLAYRSGEWDAGNLVVDELADDLRRAGFSRNDDFRPERGTDRPSRSQGPEDSSAD